MIRFLIFIVLSSLLAACTSCKKTKDEISKHTVNGMVFNNCTDSGLAGVDVYLKTYKNNSETSSLQTTSGINGNFTFTDVDIHSDNKYTYAVYIPSKSGIAAYTPEYCGFVGTTMSFSNEEVGTFMIPKVTPSFLFFNINFTQNVISTQYDTIKYICTQNVYHKNVNNLPYMITHGSLGSTLSFTSSIGNYPMGKWRIKIDKYKNGTRTITYDSIYVGWKENKAITVNW